MYEISIGMTFDAAHYLSNYDGPCNHMHGHTWKVIVYWRTRTLDHQDMICDFKVLQKRIRGIIDLLDHQVLNEVTDCTQPTAEFLARWLCNKLREASPDELILHRVTVIETPNHEVTYWND